VIFKFGTTDESKADEVYRALQKLAKDLNLQEQEYDIATVVQGV